MWPMDTSTICYPCSNTLSYCLTEFQPGRQSGNIHCALCISRNTQILWERISNERTPWSGWPLHKWLSLLLQWGSRTSGIHPILLEDTFKVLRYLLNKLKLCFHEELLTSVRVRHLSDWWRQKTSAPGGRFMMSETNYCCFAWELGQNNFQTLLFTFYFSYNCDSNW